MTAKDTDLVAISFESLLMDSYCEDKGIVMPLKSILSPCFHQESHHPSLSNGQKPYFKFHPSDEPAQIGAYTHDHMHTELSYPPESDLLKAMVAFQGPKEPLNDGAFLIVPLKRAASAESLQDIQGTLVLFKIEGGPVGTAPTHPSEQTACGPLFIKTTAELDPLSLLLSSPEAELYTCRAEEGPISTNGNIPSMDGILSASWVLCNVGGDILAKEISGILSGVISWVGHKCRDLFAFGREPSLCIVSQWSQELSIPFITWCYVHGDRDRELSVGDLKVYLVAEEGEVLRFISPVCLRVVRVGLDMGGVDAEGEVGDLHDTEGLGDKVGEDMLEGLRAQAAPEVMEGIVLWGPSIGEAAEEGKPPIEAEFSGQISFRGGEAEVDEQQGLEEALRVIALRARGGACILEQGIDEGEIHLFKECLQGVVWWDEGGNPEIYKAELFCLSHNPLLLRIDDE